MYDITISIVVYRNYGDPKIAIESIEKFTDKSISKRIYIIDNSCYGDDNAQKAEFQQFLSQWEDIEYVDTGANLGFGQGHNYIMPRLDSKYHGIINPDIVLTDDAFKTILEYMNQEAVGVVVPKLVSEDGEMIKAYRRELTIWDMFIRFCGPNLFAKRQKNHTMDHMDYSKPFDVPFAQGSFWVIRTELFRNIKGFDDRFFMYMEDADLSKRINEVSCVRYIPYTTVIHKWERGSHKNMKLLKYHIQSMYRYFKKWGFKFR